MIEEEKQNTETVTADLDPAETSASETVTTTAVVKQEQIAELKSEIADLKAEVARRQFPSIDAGAGYNVATPLTKEALAKMSAAEISRLDWNDVRRVLAA